MFLRRGWLNKAKRGDLLIGMGELAGLASSQAKQSVMQIFFDEQNQQQQQQKCFKFVYCIAVTTFMLENIKVRKQLLRAVIIFLYLRNTCSPEYPSTATSYDCN